MNNLIIWSKDRAAQLELLLRTVYSQAYNLFDSVNVIYKATTPDFECGYQIVKQSRPDILLWSEHFINFENQTKLLADNCDSVYFSTDDTILYRNCPTQLPSINYGECFSLRLGTNTIVQNCHTGELQEPLNKFVEEENTISWNPHLYHATSNYGYCFGLDMCGYNASQIRNVFKQINFKTTNELESRLFRHRSGITVMKAFRQSVAVNIPFNNISGVTACMSGTPSLSQLNNEFLNGKRLQYDTLVKTSGCHQEIPLWME